MYRRSRINSSLTAAASPFVLPSLDCFQPSRSLAVGDINGDGYSDIVVPFTYQVAWYQSVSGLGFSEATDISGSGAVWTELADFDGDSDIDVVVCSNGGGAQEGREWIAAPRRDRRGRRRGRRNI